MRYLNRIVFINSANIPYGDIYLDGNVHFSGTQGVGKSTVLRAILFFYTADKMRLGIQQGQKRFEDFYFPNSNSYIIYEVKTEISAYSILLYRSGGNAVFRFIDAPYEKEWFMDSSFHVESDWIRIRERIASNSNVDISAKIDTYEQYRNIIFGNTHDRTHQYDKYALVESPKYQNIPRSIQNVFLNSKLDADFIKSTIIQSMTDVEDSINLSAYRPQVTDFEQEFEDINCWFKKDTKGSVSVKSKAESIVTTLTSLQTYEYEIVHSWRKLNFAINATEELIPIIQSTIHRFETSIKDISSLLNQLNQNFSSENDTLIKKIAVIESKLKEINDKQSKYSAIDISTIIKKVNLEHVLKDNLSNKETLLRTLEANYTTITEKYNRIRETIQKELTSFTNLQTAALHSQRELLQKEREKFANNRDNAITVTNNIHLDWLNKSDERLSVINSEYARTDRRVHELKYYHPRAKEIAGCKEEIANLKTKEQNIELSLSFANRDLEDKRKEAETLIKQKNEEFNNEKETIHRHIANLERELSEIDSILKQWDGSLYQWLTVNKPGWEDNIGKVIDEKSVLYSNELNPQLSEDSGFFGIKIDLESIAPHHRSPTEYENHKKQITNDINKERGSISNLEKEQCSTIESIKKTYRPIIDALKQKYDELNLERQTIPLTIRNTETRLRKLEEEERSLILEETRIREDQHRKSILAKDNEMQDRQRHNDELTKRYKDINDEFNNAINELESKIKDFEHDQKIKFDEKKHEIDRMLNTCRQTEQEELNGKGADTNQIQECRETISRILSSLKDIDNIRHYVFEYNKDVEELFSHESEFKSKKIELEEKKTILKKEYTEKRDAYESERKSIESSLKHENDRLSNLLDGQKRYEELLNTERIIPSDLQKDDNTEKSSESVKDLIIRIRTDIFNKKEKFDKLKNSVQSFNSHFSQNNMFGFSLPISDEGYIDYANNLKDFLDDDKIELYRARVSDHYNAILKSISREVSMLMNHSAKISTVINDVNKDFNEKTFAGVIKSIEMRAEESSDRMMHLLLSIHKFTEDNKTSFGERNLFTDDNQDKINQKVIDYLKRFMQQLQKEQSRNELTLSDTFRLQFRIRENDNDTGWVERINNVGSDGTDILIKAMINIMLINVFKTKASRKHGEFKIHCMMDEIGKLHPSNIAGILQFANVRNIILINSSPMSYNSDIYKYNYLLQKDSKSKTHINLLIKRKD